jgi:hypothetical protein
MSEIKLKPSLSFTNPIRPSYMSDGEWKSFCMGFHQGLLEGSHAGTKLAGEMLAYCINPAPIIVDAETWNHRAEAEGEKI